MRVSSKWLLYLCVRKKLRVSLGLLLPLTLLVVWLSLPMYQVALTWLDKLVSVNRFCMVQNQASVNQLRFSKSGEIRRWHF